MSQARSEDDLLCPSARPEQSQAVVFAVIGGSVEEPLAGYLEQVQPVTPQLLSLTEPVRPTEAFRFAAPCAQAGCQHYDRDGCSLGRRTTDLLPAVVDSLPACRIRPNCRWFVEQGKDVCYRCPAIVTDNYVPSDVVAAAAQPPGSTRSAPELEAPLYGDGSRLGRQTQNAVSSSPGGRLEPRLRL